MIFNTIYDENLFRKKEKALKRYFKKSHKYLHFKLIPTLNKNNKKDGYYEVALPTSELFEKVYGKMVLKFYVKDDKAYFEDILPDGILTLCYEKSLPIYKGIPYYTTKDLKKIKIMEKLI